MAHVVAATSHTAVAFPAWIAVLAALLVLMGIGLALPKRIRSGLLPVFLAVLGFAAAATLIYHVRGRSIGAPHLPVISTRVPFEPAPEALRNADVYPSLERAAKALAERLENDVASLVENQERKPKAFNVRGDVGAHVTGAVGWGLETIAPKTPVHYDGRPKPTHPDCCVVNVELKHKPTADSLVEGTLTLTASGAGGRKVVHSARVVDKPWADNASDFASRYASKGYVAGWSYEPCSSAHEALYQARRAAATELYTSHMAFISARLGALDRGEGEAVLRNIEFHVHRAVADQFVQQAKPVYGGVWRAGVLVPAAQQQDVVFSAVSMVEKDRRRSAGTLLSVAALALVIVLLYLFLNAVTKGYFRFSLRAGAMLLLAVGVVVIMMIA